MKAVIPSRPISSSFADSTTEINAAQRFDCAGFRRPQFLGIWGPLKCLTVPLAGGAAT